MIDFSRVFTLLVDGRPTLSFEARGSKQAMQIRKESWLRDDLTSQTSNGNPLCSAKSKLSVRAANVEEAIMFNHAASVAKPSDEMLLAYLVELDGNDLEEQTQKAKEK
jgi:hypothetical protein